MKHLNIQHVALYSTIYNMKMTQKAKEQNINLSAYFDTLNVFRYQRKEQYNKSSHQSPLPRRNLAKSV